MKLKEESIKVVKESRRCINRLAIVFDVHSATIERWLLENEENGRLTTIMAITIISEETGLNQSEILTEAKITNGHTTIN